MVVVLRVKLEEMVEPLEETRNELTFATEPVLSSLHLSIPGSFQFTPLVELDEVEVSPLTNPSQQTLTPCRSRGRRMTSGNACPRRPISIVRT